MDHSGSHQSHQYRMLAVNLAASLFVMYVVMFSMIDSGNEFYNNLNMLYMALTMWAPMGILMLLTMRAMYPNKKLNLVLHIGFAGIFVLSFLGTRTQAAIGDEQFLRSMIPHHSGAILMCRQAALADPEIVVLCGQIQQSQRAEIDQMKRILERH